MALERHDIEESMHRDRYGLEDLSTSPPAVEEGAFFKLRYNQKEISSETPSLYGNIDGSSLMSLIGAGESEKAHTSKPGEQNSPVGGTLASDRFGGLVFNDFGEPVTSKVPAQPQLASEHSEKLRDIHASNSISSSNIQEEDNVYANESLDHVDFKFPIIHVQNTGRRSSIISDTVTSLNINAMKFENEENVNKLYSTNKVFSSNIQQQTTISDVPIRGRRFSLTALELSNAHVNKDTVSEEDGNDDNMHPVRRRSFMLPNPPDTVDLVSSDSDHLINPESSNAPVRERKISTSMIDFFRGGIGDLGSGSQSSDDLIQPESSNAPEPEKKTSSSMIDFFRGGIGDLATSPQSSDDLIQSESSNAPVPEKKISSSMIDFFRGGIGDLATGSQSSDDLIQPDFSNAPVPERKISRRLSESIVGFFTGIHEAATTESSVGRTQEVKDIADMNMMFR